MHATVKIGRCLIATAKVVGVLAGKDVGDPVAIRADMLTVQKYLKQNMLGPQDLD